MKISEYKSRMMFGLLGLFVPFLVHADDILKNTGLQKTAEDTFGWGSTFMNCLLLVEIVTAVITFVKVKNPMVFVGILVILVIVPVAISLIV